MSAAGWVPRDGCPVDLIIHDMTGIQNGHICCRVPDVFGNRVKSAILSGLDHIVFPYGVDDILRDSGSGKFWF